MIRPHYVPLYQSACTSEKIADLRDTEARFFYLLLLTHCDSWGRCTAGARVLTAKVWPMLGKSAADTERALADLERVGLIRRYEVEGSQFLVVPDWEDKAGRVGKVDRRGPSLYPDPPTAAKPKTARRTSPASGPETVEAAGVEPPRARAQSEPSQAEQSREFSAADAAATAGKAPPGSDPPPTALPPTPHQAIVTWFSDEYLLATGKRYAFEGGKDGNAVKELLARAGDGGLSEVLIRGRAYFDDPFHRTKSGLTLTRFLAAWNALAKASAAPGAQAQVTAARTRAEREAREARERFIERTWTDLHLKPGKRPGLGGVEVDALLLDAKYPGHEAAERELRAAGRLNGSPATPVGVPR